MRIDDRLQYVIGFFVIVFLLVISVFITKNVHYIFIKQAVKQECLK